MEFKSAINYLSIHATETGQTAIEKVIKIKKRIFAGIILFLLIVVPFLDWRLGAVMWMSAWLVFIFQKLFNRQEWKLGDEEQPDNNDDEQPDNDDNHHQD